MGRLWQSWQRPHAKRCPAASGPAPPLQQRCPLRTLPRPGAPPPSPTSGLQHPPSRLSLVKRLGPLRSILNFFRSAAPSRDRWRWRRRPAPTRRRRGWFPTPGDRRLRARSRQRQARAPQMPPPWGVHRPSRAVVLRRALRRGLELRPLSRAGLTLGRRWPGAYSAHVCPPILGWPTPSRCPNRMRCCEPFRAMSPRRRRQRPWRPEAPPGTSRPRTWPRSTA